MQTEKVLLNFSDANQLSWLSDNTNSKQKAKKQQVIINLMRVFYNFFSMIVCVTFKNQTNTVN